MLLEFFGSFFDLNQVLVLMVAENVVELVSIVLNLRVQMPILFNEVIVFQL